MLRLALHRFCLSFENHSQIFPIWHYLTIFVETPQYGICLNTLQAFKRLNLDTAGILTDLPLHQITHLELCATPLFSICNTLAQCPHLKELHLQGVCGENDLPLTVPSIHKLVVSGEDLNRLVSQLSLPGLRTLELDHGSLGSLHDLIKRSRCELESVSLIFSHGGDEGLVPFLEESPTLRSLNVTNHTGAIPTELITRLYPHENSSQLVLLPSLKTLYIDCATASDATLLVRMLKWRWDIQKNDEGQRVIQKMDIRCDSLSVAPKSIQLGPLTLDQYGENGLRIVCMAS